MSDEEDAGRFRFKLVIVGDEAVGKTSLISCLVSPGCVTDRYSPTVGAELCQAELNLPPSGAHVTLQIWDVGSQLRSLQMAANYLHGCDAVLVVFDVTRQQTLDSLLQWLALLEQMFQESGIPLVAAVANKADTPALRTAAAAAAPGLTVGCSSSECVRYCVSAKMGWGVAETFASLAARLAGLPLPPAPAAAKAAGIMGPLSGNAAKLQAAEHMEDGQRAACCGMLRQLRRWLTCTCGASGPEPSTH